MSEKSKSNEEADENGKLPRVKMKGKNLQGVVKASRNAMKFIGSSKERVQESTENENEKRPNQKTRGKNLRGMVKASQNAMKFMDSTKESVQESSENEKRRKKRLLKDTGNKLRKGAADKMAGRKKKTDALSTGLLAAQSKKTLIECINDELGGMNDNVAQCINDLFRELSDTTAITFRQVIDPIDRLVNMKHLNPKRPGPELLTIFEEIEAILESAVDEKGFKKERIAAIRANKVRIVQCLKQTLIELKYQRQFHRILMGDAGSDDEDGAGLSSESEGEQEETQVESQEKTKRPGQGHEKPKMNRFNPILSKMRALGLLDGKNKLDSEAEMDSLVPAAPASKIPSPSLLPSLLPGDDQEPMQKQEPTRGIPRHSMAPTALKQRASMAFQGHINLVPAASQGPRLTLKDLSPQASHIANKWKLAAKGAMATSSREPESAVSQGPRTTLNQERVSIASEEPRATPQDHSSMASQKPRFSQMSSRFFSGARPEAFSLAFEDLQEEPASEDEEHEEDELREDQIEEIQEETGETTLNHLHRASIISGIPIDLGLIDRNKSERLSELEKRYSVWRQSFLAFESDLPDVSSVSPSETEGSDGAASSSSNESDGEEESSLGSEFGDSPVRCWLCHKKNKCGYLSTLSTASSVARTPPCSRRCKKHENSCEFSLSSSTWSSMRRSRQKHETSAMIISSSTWSMNSTWSQDFESEQPSWRKRRLRRSTRPFRPFGERLVPRFPEEPTLAEEEPERHNPSLSKLGEDTRGSSLTHFLRGPSPSTFSKNADGEETWGPIAQSLRHRMVEVSKDSVYLTGHCRGHCRFHRVTSSR